MDCRVIAHNHVNWASWDTQLAAANCSANYSTAMGAVSRSGDDGKWVTSSTCFGMQLKFLSVAACKYFAQVDCAARCNAAVESEVTAEAGGGVADAFGNPEFHYCGLFCRNRETLFTPPGDDGTTLQLGCAHARNATQCGCPISGCDVPIADNATTMSSNGSSSSSSSSSGGGGGNVVEAPDWCTLYCDKVADSCAAQPDATGCGQAEAKATLGGGALVNISRVVTFSFPAGAQAVPAAAAAAPSLDSACSTADEACAAADSGSSSSSQCRIADVAFSGMGTDDARVTGLVTGLLDAPLDPVLLMGLVDNPPAAAEPENVVELRPQLNMLCLSAVRLRLSFSFSLTCIPPPPFRPAQGCRQRHHQMNDCCGCC